VYPWKEVTNNHERNRTSLDGADGQREAGDVGVCQRAKHETMEAVSMEVFWIGEVCDADRRTKLITKEAKEWFATRTIEQAIISHQEKTTAATVAQ